MILLTIGKKGAGKSTALRRLVYRRLLESPRSTVFWVDTGCQVKGGALFESIATARAHFASAGVPRLCIYRGCDVEDVAALALELHDVTLVVDELDRACSGKTWRAPSVRRIVHEGRHERVDLWGSFRSTRNVHEDLVGQCDAALLFRQTEAGYYDLQTLKLRFGPAMAEAVQRLEPMHFVMWADD